MLYVYMHVEKNVPVHRNRQSRAEEIAHTMFSFFFFFLHEF